MYVYQTDQQVRRHKVGFQKLHSQEGESALSRNRIPDRLSNPEVSQKHMDKQTALMDPGACVCSCVWNSNNYRRSHEPEIESR